MINKPKVSISIPTYKGAKNIYQMVKNIIEQKQKNYILHEVLIHIDASPDNTIEVLKKIKDKRVKINNSNHRKGFAHAFKILILQSSGDIVIALNDDIKIADNNFIEKLIQPFFNNKKVGLVCGSPQPLPPNSFIERALISRLRASEMLSIKHKDGNNLFGCDGKILTLSRSFIKSINFPEDYSLLGNVDAFLYFSCLTKGFEFFCVRNAVVYYRNPSTISDYIAWISRNNLNQPLLRKQFGEIVKQEYKKPTGLFFLTIFQELLRNPLGCLAIFSLELYMYYFTFKKIKKFNPTWTVVRTTKDL